MWVLVSVSQPDLKFVIVGEHQYVVGRQNCDIVIPDASVSRQQAVLTMVHYESNVAKSFMTPTLTLEDVSKFGTHVNGKQVKNPGGNTITLKHNDEIKFGGSPVSIFRAMYEPFIATTSCLEKAPKKCLHKIMCLLGGHIVRDWRPTCDLLIMSNINVTIKVICAINNQKHIVKPKYLDDLYAYYNNNGVKPDPIDYLPQVVDQEVPQGVSFHPNIKRATLLEGLKFYFLSAIQFNKTNLAVSTAGGQPILLEDGTEEDAETMTQEDTVVVAVTRDILSTLNPSCQKFVKLVFSTLKRKQLRMVTDPEIGWSILTCNTDDFCNPRSPITPSMLSAMASQSLSQVTEMDTSHDALPNEIRLAKRPHAVDEENKRHVSEPQAKKMKNDLNSEECSYISVKNKLRKSEKITKKDSNFDEDQNSVLFFRTKSTTSCENKTFSLLDCGRCDDSLNEQKSKDNCTISRGPTISNVVPDNSCYEQSKEHKEVSPLSEAGNIFALQKLKHVKVSRKKDSEEEEEEVLNKKPKAQKHKPMFFEEEDDHLPSKDFSALSSRSLSSSEIKNNKVVDNNSEVLMNSPHHGDKLMKAHDEPISIEHIGTPSHCNADVKSMSGWISKETEGRKIVPDIKPDPELPHNDDGELIRNMCDVQFVPLVTHQEPKAKGTTTAYNGRSKNVKKFKKTEHIGSKKLPTIIGGRDLQVYMGSSHKNIEEFFLDDLSNENGRQKHEKKGRGLFDWDDDQPNKTVR